MSADLNWDCMLSVYVSTQLTLAGHLLIFWGWLAAGWSRIGLGWAPLHVVLHPPSRESFQREGRGLPRPLGLRLARAHCHLCLILLVTASHTASLESRVGK